MGLLDDAIREHLELKRRRGADPTEIERDEREALGPVRRRYEESGGPAEPELGAAADVGPEGLEEEAEWDEPFPDSESRRRSPELGDEDLEAPEAPGHWEEHDPFPAVDSAAPSPEPAPPSIHGLDAETSEYEVPLDDDAEGEDVLEETPDFLQDAPDHDRLWFEQRPPRDFDFDG